MKLEVGVKALISNEKGQFLLIQFTDTPNEQSRQRWDIPGGRLKDEETLLEALTREIKAQVRGTLLSCAVLSAQDIILSDIGLHIVQITYKTTIQGDLRIGAAEGIYTWASPAEALQLPIDSHLRRTMQMLEAST